MEGHWEEVALCWQGKTIKAHSDRLTALRAYHSVGDEAEGKGKSRGGWTRPQNERPPSRLGRCYTSTLGMSPNNVGALLPPPPEALTTKTARGSSGGP